MSPAENATLALPERAPTLLPARGFARLVRDQVLSRLAHLGEGRLTVNDLTEGGRQHVFGGSGGLQATVTIRDPRAWASLALGGTIGAADAYADAWWDTDDVAATIRIVLGAGDGADAFESGLAKVGALYHRLRHRVRKNTIPGARENIAAHYDLGNEFFELFLDPTMTYSCALYERPDMTLHEAQVAKIDRICRKLDLKPGQHLLEIGTGWGALAMHAAREYGVKVTTTTLSRRQHEFASRRVAEAGLSDRITLLLSDYRELTGQHDRLVSIEMIEAVGWEYYEAYFGQVGRLLTPDGLALIQAITIPDHRFETWKTEPNHINRSVFPGSCIPSTTALLQAASRSSDLRLFHLEEIGPHYAPTLRAWHDALVARWGEARAQGKSERFLRTFAYYLASCEAGFAERYHGDVQLLFAKPRSKRDPAV
ncbi:MAG: cyclopropane-fatty-acyl-phospholipid synthase family protein [Anaeromyxobacter sp.]